MLVIYSNLLNAGQLLALVIVDVKCNVLKEIFNDGFLFGIDNDGNDGIGRCFSNF